MSRRIYKSFSEIATDFKAPSSWTHSNSKHSHHPAVCDAWQQGITEFAKFLDEIGMKIVQNPDIYNELWRRVREFPAVEPVAHPVKQDENRSAPDPTKPQPLAELDDTMRRDVVRAVIAPTST